MQTRTGGAARIRARAVALLPRLPEVQVPMLPRLLQAQPAMLPRLWPRRLRAQPATLPRLLLAQLTMLSRPLLALGLALSAAVAAAAPPLRAAEVKVAVAANFTSPLDEVGRAFTRATGHRIAVSSGSTGKLAAQVQNGAPFEVLLAADAERPAKLEQEGAAVAGSRFTYARGRLVLWSPDPKLVDPAGKVLAGGRFRHLAIANPKLAPYGAAAEQVLTGLGLWQRLAPLLVQGEDLGQAYQFVASGAAELGFVALSQLRAAAGGPRGSAWIVPEASYRPIEQQAVLLARGRDDPAARAFLEFLKGREARAVIERYGYGLP